MKIGILTFHDGINHGTFLQVYALYRILLQLFPKDDIKVINYKDKSNSWNEYKVFIMQKNIISVIRNIFKIIKFKTAHKELNLTKRVFNVNGVEDENFDVIIYGSDEIWNYSHSMMDIDKMYFGWYLQNTKKISYAPSFSEAKFENFPNDLNMFTNNFHSLSVRDKHSRDIIDKIDDARTCPLVLDPTFLYDFEHEVIYKVEKDYLLIYCAGIDSGYVKYIKEFAKEKNLQIISIGYKNKFADKNIIAVDPFLWIGYFKNAKYVITNTFHGTVFSIKYNKKFISILKEDKQNKIKFLLDEFKLSHMICSEYNNISNIFNESINYIEVNKLIKQKVDMSTNFLLSSILN